MLGTTPSGSSKAGAFALVPAELERVIKDFGTDAPPTLVTFTPDGEHALIAVRDDARAVYGAYLVELGSLAETLVPLASAPLSVGVIAKKKRAFVAEHHPEGRITFFDLTTGEAHTLTGFGACRKSFG